MKQLTAEWVAKAEGDIEVAELVAREKKRSHDIVCFYCPQAAEKYLNAALQEQSVGFPKIHDLMALYLLLPSTQQRGFRGLRRGLQFLTQFAIDPRYLLVWPTKRQANSALRWAGKVRDECRRILGI